MLDVCVLISASQLADHFGAHPSLVTSSPSRYEDPNSLDCAWKGLDSDADASVTTHGVWTFPKADIDADLADAEEARRLDGVDWGWIYAAPERGVYFFEFTRGDISASFTITVDNSDHDAEDIEALFDEVLDSLTATSA